MNEKMHGSARDALAAGDIRERYARQLGLPQVGETGQQKLFDAKVLVVGAGGLGSPVLYYLAAAGVGTLGIVDHDVVEISNLQRQILHWEKDLGKEKVVSAGEKLAQFNSRIQIDTHFCHFDKKKAREIIPQYDIVVAAVDNMMTRDIINTVCYEMLKPWVNGGVNRFSGMVTTFQPPKGPCLRCLYPEDKNSKSDSPTLLLGTLPGIIGVLQAQEVLKLILGIGTPLTGKFLIFEGLETRMDEVTIAADPNCPICNK